MQLLITLPLPGEPEGAWIAYDVNGNILKYLPKSITGTAAHMDSLHYDYYAGTNRLRRIRDSVPANGYVDPANRIIDIDGQSDNNYGYDAIGNLIRDDAEKITGIKWNVYGKIQEITKNESGAITTIKYTYDAVQPPQPLHTKPFGYPDGNKNRELPIEWLTNSAEAREN